MHGSKVILFDSSHVLGYALAFLYAVSCVMLQKDPVEPLSIIIHGKWSSAYRWFIYASLSIFKTLIDS